MGYTPWFPDWFVDAFNDFLVAGKWCAFGFAWINIISAIHKALL